MADDTPDKIDSIAEVAEKANEIIDGVMKVEPIIAGIAGMFVPQVAQVQPWVLIIMPYLQRALNDIAQNNGGDAMNAIIELIQHLSAGQPNASGLAPDTTTTTPVEVPNLS